MYDKNAELVHGKNACYEVTFKLYVDVVIPYGVDEYEFVHDNIEEIFNDAVEGDTMRRFSIEPSCYLGEDGYIHSGCDPTI